MTLDSRTAAALKRVLTQRPLPAEDAFRRSWNAVVAGQESSNPVELQATEAAGRLGDVAATWLTLKAPGPADWKEAHTLLELRQKGLPEGLLTAALELLPRKARAPDEVAAGAIFGADLFWLRLLVRRGHIPASRLTRAAKTRPIDFYQSAALDVLLDQRVPIPRQAWKSFSEGLMRPEGLLDPATAIVRSFEFDTAADAARWLAGFLAVSNEVRPQAIRALLRVPAAASRLAAYIGTALPREAVAKGVRAEDGLPDVAAGMIEESLRWKEEEPGAAVIPPLDLLTVAGSGLESSVATDAVRTRAAELGEFSSAAVTRVLRRFEDSGEGGQAVIVTGAAPLYRAVQEYMRALPIAGASESTEPDRARRFARYEGQREILTPLVAALTENTDESLRTAVEAVLHNAGVRPIGAPGEVVVMRSDLHQTSDATLLPGDQAIIAIPGRRLGEGPVLTRALVHPRAPGIPR